MSIFASLLLTYSADSSFGRLDYASLPEQTLMELLIEAITDTAPICGEKDCIKKISKWKGIAFDTARRIIRIQWAYHNFSGSVDLQWLPPFLESLTLEDNHLEGSINLTALPDSMEYMWMGQNAFSGEIDLTALPKKMTAIDLSNNNLSGSLDLTQLPDSFLSLFLDGNIFCGTIDLTRLPPGMKALYVHDNDLWGETDFSQLPPSLRKLFVKDTQLSGTIVLKKPLAVSVKNSKVTFIKEK